jgi:hypothetical protein
MNNYFQSFFKRFDNKIKVIEDKSIIFILTFFLFFIFGNKFLVNNNIKFALNNFDAFLMNELGSQLSAKEGVLITVAAVFIGIYFTVFSLLGSIKIESTFVILTEENFRRLLIYIRNAFLGSLVYLFYSLFANLVTNIWLYTVISLILLLYMVLSALRFGLIIYSIFTKDLNKFHKHTRDIANEKKKIDNLNKRLEAFLLREEQEQDTRISVELVEKMKQREKSKKTE